MHTMLLKVAQNNNDLNLCAPTYDLYGTNLKEFDLNFIAESPHQVLEVADHPLLVSGFFAHQELQTHPTYCYRWK